MRLIIKFQISCKMDHLNQIVSDRHLDYLNRDPIGFNLMNNISAGTFTNKKSVLTPGYLSLSIENQSQRLLEDTLTFMKLARELRVPNLKGTFQVCRAIDIPMNIESYLEPLPFSTSWSYSFCHQWGFGKVILNIEVPFNSGSYLIASYPDSQNIQHRYPEFNPEQHEVVLGPARIHLLNSRWILADGDEIQIINAGYEPLSEDDIIKYFDNPDNYQDDRFPSPVIPTIETDIIDALLQTYARIYIYYSNFLNRPANENYDKAHQFIKLLSYPPQKLIIENELSSELSSELDPLFPWEFLDSDLVVPLFINLSDPDRKYFASLKSSVIYNTPVEIPIQSVGLNIQLTPDKQLQLNHPVFIKNDFV